MHRFALLACGIVLAALPVRAAETPRLAALDAFSQSAPELDPSVLALALRATSCAARRGLVPEPSTLTVIDYSRPSTETRLFVLDLERTSVVYRDRVAHGKNSGDNLATRFSNRPGSLQSSLGLFVTLDPYLGRHGRSLRLDGLEPGFNDRALERAIVIHGASYVGDSFALRLGRMGRSWGCPALPVESAQQVIDRIRGGTAVFAYYPDPAWLASSEFLRCDETASAVRQLPDVRDQVANAGVVDHAAPRRHQR